MLSLSSSVGKVIAHLETPARDFNPDTGNVPDGLYEVVNVHEKKKKSPSLCLDRETCFDGLFFVNKLLTTACISTDLHVR